MIKFYLYIIIIDIDIIVILAKENMDDILNAFYSDIKDDIKETPKDNKKNIFSVEPIIDSNPLESTEKGLYSIFLIILIFFFLFIINNK